jgi:hypothetical protein
MVLKDQKSNGFVGAQSEAPSAGCKSPEEVDDDRLSG